VNYPAPVAQPKLGEINLGSEVEVVDVTGAIPPFTGTVVGSTNSFGASRIPAIHLKHTGSDDVVVVTDTGKWKVRVLVDSALLGSSAPPESLVHIRTKPHVKQAVQFVGGGESAAGIIRWGGGRAAITWRQPTADTTEALLVHTPEGVMEATIGDWVICGLQGEFYPCKPDVFLKTYDVVDASQATPIPQVGQRASEAQLERQQMEAAARAAMLQGHQQQGQR
jgi:hypothetical protein